MRGIDPSTDPFVQGDEPRIRQAFINMKLIAESEGATLRDKVRLVVYVTDMYPFRQPDSPPARIKNRTDAPFCRNQTPALDQV
jgi:hypothetical protein